MVYFIKIETLLEFVNFEIGIPIIVVTIIILNIDPTPNKPMYAKPIKGESIDAKTTNINAPVPAIPCIIPINRAL